LQYTDSSNLYTLLLSALLLLYTQNRVGPARVGDSATAFRNLIDSWAVRFMEELDYLTEAANADRFRTEMAKSEALGEAIIVPRVHHALTDRYVLVTGTHAKLLLLLTLCNSCNIHL
jgi:ABC1 atypical kinase-like domain